MMKQTNTKKRSLWHNMKFKLQAQLIRLVREYSSRYIVWRLDRGWPVTGSGLRFIERRLSSAANRCQAAEQKPAPACRIYAIGR